jgi:hypothetical protein
MSRATAPVNLLRGRARPLSGSALVALLAVGCGHSSKGTSTRSTAGTPAPPATVASSAPQPPAPPAPSLSRTVTGTSHGVTASLRAGTHDPTVARPWPLHFAVMSGGRGVKASVSYEYLLNGQVVAHRSHYTFTGHFSDVFMWPSAAVGYPLTFRAVIVSQGVTINLDYPVQVAG